MRMDSEPEGGASEAAWSRTFGRATGWGLQPNASAGFDERMEVGGNLRRRELIKPVLVPCPLELALLNGSVEDKAGDTIDQCCNDAHQRDNGCATERPDWGFAQDGVIVFECTVGSLGR